jgi:hypothetical protein
MNPRSTRTGQSEQIEAFLRQRNPRRHGCSRRSDIAITRYIFDLAERVHRARNGTSALNQCFRLCLPTRGRGFFAEHHSLHAVMSAGCHLRLHGPAVGLLHATPQPLFAAFTFPNTSPSRASRASWRICRFFSLTTRPGMTRLAFGFVALQVHRMSATVIGGNDEN